MAAAAVAAVAVGITASVGRATTGTAAGNEFRPESEHAMPTVPASATASWDARHGFSPANSQPGGPATPVVSAGSELTSNFDALNFFDQRYADNGNQFSLEPPDQGLCTNGGDVIEAVNTVFAIYDAKGKQVSGPGFSGIESLTEFFTGQPQIVRHSDGTATYGPFLSDPKCLYDTATGRWFMTILELGQDPITGDYDGTSSELIAVSKTSTPSIDPNDWYHYSIDTSNNGGSANDSGGAARTLPTHPGCPCFGDQPLIGADAYGFYITSNEYPITGPGFNGAQVYAFDKAGLEAGTLKFQYVAGASGSLPLAEGTAYSLQPATSPSAGDFDTSNNGTEYLLSALQFADTYDNRIAVWALTNTQSLTTATPNVQLQSAVLHSETYGQPTPAEQKDGPHPFGQWGAHFYYGGPRNQPVNTLNTNDDRMNQVVYAGGSLWSGVNTIEGEHNGIAWFVVRPSIHGGTLSGTVMNQGYITVPGQNVFFPSIGVTPGGGHAVMTMTLSGDEYYPSAVYSVFRGYGFGAGFHDVRIAGAGVGPADGFTGYIPFAPDGVERWGDYSAAVGVPDGSVWVATEYINQVCRLPQYKADPTCGGTRGALANWGTRIAQITP